MTDWVRLWHDMPTDPKWRTIARKSKQRVGDVIAVFNFLMVNASGNATERGKVTGFDCEDVATALDLDETDVEAILDAMRGKVLDDSDCLTGWEKRQPKREDSTASVRKAAWKERQRNAEERSGMQGNAPETDAETETETDKKEDKKGGYAFCGTVIRLKPADYARWASSFPDVDLKAALQSRDDWLGGQDEAARSKWFNSTSSWLAKRQQQTKTDAKKESEYVFPVA
jgi:hypothetical protein